MPSSSTNDKRWLEKHGNKWRVVVPVPRALQAQLGTKLKRSLGTDSLSNANVLKWGVIQDLKAVISRASGEDPIEYAVVMREATSILKQVNDLARPELDEAQRAVNDRADEIRGPHVAVEVDDEGQPYPVYDPGRERLAKSFNRLAMGISMPVDMYLEEYREGLKVKARTEKDLDRAVLRLREWCFEKKIPDDLRSITTIVAKQFATELRKFGNGLAPRTIKKYVSRLHLYWHYMQYHEKLKENPWFSVVVEVPVTKHDEEERAFTEAEVVKLLTGPAEAKLLDVMMIGALSGARLDAIVDLKVKDTAGGIFTFKPQKLEPAPRDVPIHPALMEIVQRRSEGKNPEDDLFPDYPRNAQDSLRERSFKTSNDFTEYRRLVGVDQKVEGKRRALTNFHSFRRWFITKAERAGYDRDLVAAIVGHKRSGMTLGRYSEGPEMRRARRCVKAVKLPPLDGSPVVEPRALTPRNR